MATEQGLVWCKSNDLEKFKGIWFALTKILNTYAEKLERDLPHYYNERATVSFLNAAAWKADLIAIEEYSTLKSRGDSSYSGRCDLYLAQQDGIEAEFEAKQNWITGSAGADQTAISNWINLALDAARQNKSTDLKYGMNFLVPEISASLGMEQASSIYDQWKREFLDQLSEKEEVECLYVWEHPEAKFRALESRHAKGLCYWPGLWVAISRPS